MINEHPGKFEGEPSYAEALYNLAMGGGSDEELMDDDTEVSVFECGPSLAEDANKAFDGKIDDDDLATLRGDGYIVCWESEDGFWNTEHRSREAYALLKAELEAEEHENGDEEEGGEEEHLGDDPA